MIYKDTLGFVVEQGGDGGDSSMRFGMLALCGVAPECDYKKYEKRPGYFIRYPYMGQSFQLAIGSEVLAPDQDRWNNEWNFSRDQLICLVAGLNKLGEHAMIRRVFYSHMLRFFTCQNWQHDRPGTYKYPWPHKSTWNGERVWFDAADILLPHNIWTLIKGGRVYWAYPFFLIALPVFLLDMFIHIFVSKHAEENQFIAQASFYGTWPLRFYRMFKKNWREGNRKYWQDRKEDEYAEIIEQYVGNA